MKHRILLIEDEETFRDSIALILSDRSDVEIVWASAGASGIQAYQKSPNGFSVVLIDYLLPDLRGSARKVSK